MWRMRVGFTDTTRRIQGEVAPEKEPSPLYVKSFHLQYCKNPKIMGNV